MATDPNAPAENIRQASTEQPPQHEVLSPEEAARLIKQNGESELLSAEEIASSLRDQVEEYGPAELETGGTLYTIWPEDE